MTFREWLKLQEELWMTQGPVRVNKPEAKNTSPYNHDYTDPYNQGPNSTGGSAGGATPGAAGATTPQTQTADLGGAKVGGQRRMKKR
jgi:hypothetical protein